MEESSIELKSRIINYLQNDEIEEALVLSKAHSQEKANIFCKYYIGLSYKLLGQIDNALNVFEDFEEEEYQSKNNQIHVDLKIELFQQMAEIYFQKGLYAKSAEYYLKLIEIDKNQPSYFKYAILSFMKINQLYDAVKLGRNAIQKFIPLDIQQKQQQKENKQEIVELLTYTARCYFQLKDYKQAISVLTTSEQFSNFNSQMVLSDIYFKAGMFEQAENLNQQLLNSMPDSQELLINMARIQLNNLNFAKTNFYIQQIRKVNIDCQYSYYSSGICLYLQDNLEQGICQMEMACSLDDSKNYDYLFTLIVMYIQKAYLTQDNQYFEMGQSILNRELQSSQQNHLNLQEMNQHSAQNRSEYNSKDNPIFQYFQALLYRLNSQDDQFQKYWTQIYHIQIENNNNNNYNNISRHPSQDIYDQLDDSSKQLLSLIPQLDLINCQEYSNPYLKTEIYNQKTMLFYQILKINLIPSLRMKKLKFLELLQQIHNINRFSEICSLQFQQNNVLSKQNILLNQHIFGNDKTLFEQFHEIEQTETQKLNETQKKNSKKDKNIVEFFNDFQQITQEILDLANEFFIHGFKLNRKLSSFNDKYLKSIIIIASEEIHQHNNKLDDLTIEDLNLPSKLRKIYDLGFSRGGGYIWFKELILIGLNCLDEIKIKESFKNKEKLKRRIDELNKCKQIFAYKRVSEGLSIDLNSKLYAQLLIDNQDSVKYNSYSLSYYFSLTSISTNLITQSLFSSLHSYSSQYLQQSIILSSQSPNEKCCSIF